MLQCFVRTADLDKVYAAEEKVLAAANVNAMKLDAFKYYYIPAGGAMGVAGICAKPTPEILKLQADIIAAASPFNAGKRPHRRVHRWARQSRHDAAMIKYVSTFERIAAGEHFNPHVSTGTAPTGYLDKMVAEPFETFTFSPAGAAVYQLGPFGTAAKKLKEWDLAPDGNSRSRSQHALRSPRRPHPPSWGGRDDQYNRRLCREQTNELVTPAGRRRQRHHFFVLYITSLELVRLAVPADPKDPGVWLTDPTYRNWVRIALNLVPFTGIAFLWFMAVLRNRIGLLEDRFFATVFLGSGLLFVAMLFAAVAVSRGLLETFAAPGRLSADSETYAVGRAMAYALMNTFGMKMAAIFMFVTSTIGLRTAVLAAGYHSWASRLVYYCYWSSPTSHGSPWSSRFGCF